MKIVTYNIQFGLGKDGRNDLARIAGEVDGADIIALQEVERNWQHSDRIDQPEVLGRLLSNYYWVYGPYFDVDASRKNPNGMITNIRRQFGNMILSKTPVLSSRLFPFSKTKITDRRNMAVGMLEGVVDVGNGRALRIYNIHLSAKSGSDRISQIHAARRIIARAPPEGGAWTGAGTQPLWYEDAIAPPMPGEFILLGDFNHAPHDAEYSDLMKSEGDACDLVDCWTLTGHRLCDGVTYPNADPNGKNIRVDFAFVDQMMRDSIKHCRIDSSAQGSDHQPLWINTLV